MCAGLWVSASSPPSRWGRPAVIRPILLVVIPTPATPPEPVTPTTKLHSLAADPLLVLAQSGPPPNLPAFPTRRSSDLTTPCAPTRICATEPRPVRAESALTELR